VNYAPLRQARNRPRRKTLARNAVAPRTSTPRIRKTNVWNQVITLRTAFTPPIVSAQSLSVSGDRRAEAEAGRRTAWWPTANTLPKERSTSSRVPEGDLRCLGYFGKVRQHREVCKSICISYKMTGARFSSAEPPDLAFGAAQ
jgi:hypothetical protein